MAPPQGGAFDLLASRSTRPDSALVQLCVPPGFHPWTAN